MNFTEALADLQRGRAASRKEWHDDRGRIAKIVFMQIPAHIPSEIVPNMQSVPHAIKRLVADKGAKELHYSNQMAIVDITNKDSFAVEGYSPSVPDILASDWFTDI